MIDLYFCLTSNGMRATIGLSEAGIAFHPHPLDMAAGATRTPEFLKINPPGTAPVLVDSGAEPMVLAQSGAILMHVAERSGRMLPADARQRALAWQWTMFACSDCAGASTGIGMARGLGGECAAAASAMYEARLVKLVQVAEERLAGNEWLAGNEFSIADVALFPVYEYRKAVLESAQTPMPHIARWSAAMRERPAVRQGIELIAGPPKTA